MSRPFPVNKDCAYGAHFHRTKVQNCCIPPSKCSVGQSKVIDELDRNIISLLGADARMSVATLARRLKVARSTVQTRLERLETTGMIAGYTLKLGEAAREGRLRASVLVTIEPRAQAGILIRLKNIPEVERVYTTSGRFDLLMQVAAPNTRALDDVLDQIGALTGVKSSESLIHLSTRLDRAV
jgi:DNA-binding Lrp family transcriptional regulator